ncbi:hypothetical protein D3C78_1649180 [compost metagenome]
MRLAHDFLAQRRHRHLTCAALEQLDIQLFLELLDGHRQRGLRDITGFCRMPKMLLASHGNDVLEFSEGHEF